MREEYSTKLQFKFDMGKNELGKSVMASKTFENLKRDYQEYDKLVELGHLIADVIEGNGLFATYIVSVDDLGI